MAWARKPKTGFRRCSRCWSRRIAAPTLLACCLALVTLSQPEVGVQALKLPSLFSWMQTTNQINLPPTQSSINLNKNNYNAAPSMSLIQQQHQNQIPLRTAGGSNQLAQSTVQLVKSISAGKPQPLEDSMMASASVFEPNGAQLNSLGGNGNQAQQQQVGGDRKLLGGGGGHSLRKPFQSILMLPSKHNQMHLFSALPKSLFGRLLASSPSNNNAATSTLSPTNQKPTPLGSLWNPSQPLRSLYPVANQPASFPNEQQQQQQQLASFMKDATGNGNGNQLQFSLQQQQQQQQHHNHHQQQQQQQQARPMRPPGAGRALEHTIPKKHALGFGDSGDFIMVDSSQLGGMEEEQQHQNEHEQPQQSFESQQANQLHMIKGDEILQEPPAGIILSGEHEIHESHAGEQVHQQPSNSSLSMMEQQLDEPAQVNGNKTLSTVEPTSSQDTFTNGTNWSTAGAENSADTLRVVPATVATNQTTEVAVQSADLQVRDIAAAPPTTTTTTTTETTSAGQQQQQQQQWDTETASSVINSANVNATMQQAGDQLQQVNSTASSGSSSGDGADDGQQTILFLDSQSFQQLQRESQQAAANGSADSSKRMHRPFLVESEAGDSEDGRRPFGTRPQPFQRAQAQAQSFIINGIQQPETSGSESSTAAIIVAPGDSSDPSGFHQSISEQLAGDEQLESFILGPYKGLTSDNLEQQQQHLAEQTSQHQFRGLAPAASTITNSIHLQQQPSFHTHKPSPPQSAGGITNKASSLLLQAKSIIQYPFIHLAGQSNSGPGQGNGFRGQTSVTLRDPMLKDQSAPPSGFATSTGQQQQQTNLPMASHPNSRQQTAASLKQTNYHPASLTPQLAGFYGNKVVGHQQPQPAQQNIWPQASAIASGRPPTIKQEDGGNRLTPTNPSNSHNALAANGLQQHASYFLMAPPPAPQQQQQQIPGSSHHHLKQAKQLRFQANQQAQLPQMSATQTFHHHQAPLNRIPSQQQQQTSHMMMMTQPAIKSNVPYFVDLQQQQQPLNREQQQQQQRQVQAQTQMSDNNLRASFQTGPQQQHLQPLNNMRQQRQHGFQLVIDHANSRPSLFHEQQQHQGAASDLNRQQPSGQQSLLSQQQARKFKSGLYQIDPPKLSDSESASASATSSGAFEQQQQKQQQQLVQDSSDMDSDDDSEIQQQQQLEQQQERIRMTGDGDQMRKLNDNDDESSADSEDGEQLSQQATESPEVGGGDAPFTKQVGASIGVGGQAAANNRSQQQIRGQVFNEPLTSHHNTKGGGGQMSSELKSLKVTQDITLYDFEHLPQSSASSAPKPTEPANGLASSGSQLSISNGVNHHQPKQPNGDGSSQPISFLDTQVYTVPYTITMPQPQTPSGVRQPIHRQQPPVAYHQFQTYTQHHSMRPSPSTQMPTQHQQPLIQQASSNQLHLQQQQMNIPQQYQQQQQQQANQLGRFPLPYLAPPAPVRPQQQQQLHLHPQYQQQFLKSLYQELSNQQASQIDWAHPSLPSIPALSIQTLDSSGSGDDDDDDESDGQQQPETMVNTLPTNTRQHYFHYQPMQNNQGIQMRPHQPMIYQQPTTNRLQPATEQIQYELANGQLPMAGKQFLMAIQHQHQTTDQESPNASVQSTMGPATSQQRNEITTEGSITASGSVLTSPSSGSDGTSAGSLTSNQPTTEASSSKVVQQSDGSSSQPTELDDLDDDEESPVAHSALPEAGSRRKQRPGSAGSGRQQPLLVAKQSAAAIDTATNGQQPSSPSTFCADRAPGLYADESQRCKAYYQCAPTGHQMFKCNNQTQFNQKTQNCDWWYNVNCGGRQGSQSDFEPAAVVMMMTSEPATTKQQQPDREAAASSHETTGALSIVDSELEAQQKHLAAIRQQQQQQQNRQTSKIGSRWSSNSRQQQQQQQQRPEEDSIMFREVAVNSSSGGSSSTEPAPFQSQLFEQQAVPTSATPIYSEMSQSIQEQQRLQFTSRAPELESFSQRSSTTQDPQLVLVSSTEAPEEIHSSGPSLPEPKPQVGANLSEEQQQSSSATKSSSDEQSANTNDTNNNSTASTSTSLISDFTSSTQLSSSVGSSNSTSAPEPEASSVASSNGPAATSGDQQPESRLGQQQQRLFPQQQQQQQQQQDLSVVDGLDLEQEPELRDQQNQQSQQQQQQSVVESKRLVQSEFGLGVQQPQQQQQQFREGSKSARSAIRFEFTRNGLSVRPHPQSMGDSQQQELEHEQPMLITGNLFSGDNEPIMGQPQYSNHKYSFGDHNQAMSTNDNHLANGNLADQTGSSGSIYATSANQGSINYVPIDVHFLTAKGVQEAGSSAAIPDQSSSVASTTTTTATATAITLEPIQQASTTVATLSTEAFDSSSASASASTPKSPAAVGRKLDRRFGVRLLSPASTTTGTPTMKANRFRPVAA